MKGQEQQSGINPARLWLSRLSFNKTVPGLQFFFTEETFYLVLLPLRIAGSYANSFSNF